MKPLILVIIFLSTFVIHGQTNTLQRAPTSPSSSTDTGTGPTLGGAMSGEGTGSSSGTDRSSSIYGPPRGNEFPEERMESPEQTIDETTIPKSNLKKDIPQNQVVPGGAP